MLPPSTAALLQLLARTLGPLLARWALRSLLSAYNEEVGQGRDPLDRLFQRLDDMIGDGSGLTERISDAILFDLAYPLLALWIDELQDREGPIYDVETLPSVPPEAEDRARLARAQRAERRRPPRLLRPPGDRPAWLGRDLVNAGHIDADSEE